MEISYLHEFLVLANTLNFTKASTTLHMSQPTLSRHIAELENQIGSPLFVRTTNSVRLTDSGRMLYEKANLLLSDYNNTLDEVRLATNRSVSTIKVSTSLVPTVEKFLAIAQARAASEHKPIRFKSHKTRSMSNDSPVPYSLDMLANHEVDFVLDAFPLSDSNLIKGFGVFRLFDEHLSVIASAGNPLVQAHNLKLEDLFANALVIFAIQQHCLDVHLEPLSKAGYSPHRAKVIFVDDIFEIPERLALLADDEIVTMQESMTDIMGVSKNVNCVAPLDVQDKRCKHTIAVLYRENEKNETIDQALELFGDVLADLKAQASNEDWSDEGTLWSSVLY